MAFIAGFGSTLSHLQKPQSTTNHHSEFGSESRKINDL
jgi:hypothetical protein